MLHLTRLIGLLLVAIPPLLGAWLASSLTAMASGPPWLAATAGVVLFPVLPLLWEVGWLRRRAAKARAARAPPRQPFLQPYARFLVRTTVVSIVFLGFLLAWFPERSFLALATRGDWFLDSPVAGEAPSMTRRVLFGAARGLEGLYAAAREDPYRGLHDTSPLPDEQPRPAPGVAGTVKDAPAQAASPGPDAGPALDPAPRPRVEQLCARLEDGRQVCIDAQVRDPPPDAPDAGVEAKPSGNSGMPEEPPRLAQVDGTWPAPATLHAALERMTSSDETSLQAVADYLKARTQSGADRVRALHDWVADRIAYDGASFRARSFPSQDPEAVLSTRTAVCAGYSRLLARLGQLAGEEIVYLTGDAKGFSGLEGHAWNAARVNGGWVLIDVTWDAGFLNTDYTFKKQFTTDFVFAPPAFFTDTHLPEDARWQLLDPPLDRVAFLRSHGRTPALMGSGIEIVAPPANTDVGYVFPLVLKNPAGHDIFASVCPPAKRCTPCEGAGPGAVRLNCRAPIGGAHVVHLAFGATPGSLVAGATFQVNRP